MSEEDILNLCWNNHTTEFRHMLSAVRTVEKYTDVTLACGDQTFYPAHKLILSTYSNYFQRIFEYTPCKHPVIVLKDVSGRDMAALLSYMYEGKVSVVRSSLSSLIRAAKHLQIKGFALSEDQLPSAKKRVQQPENRGSQQHKRQRRVKQERLDTMHDDSLLSPPEEDLLPEESRIGVEEQDSPSTTSHIIISRMKDNITVHQVPSPEEEVLVETTIGEQEDGQSNHLQIDLHPETSPSQDFPNHKVTVRVREEASQDTTLFQPSFIKREITAELDPSPLHFQEEEALHRKQMHLVAMQLAQSDKSLVLSEEKYEAILAHLRNPSLTVNPKFRHWVKSRRFRIMDLPEMGLQGVLAIPNRESLYSDDLKPVRYLHVVPAYQAYDVVYQIHSQRLNHAGYKRVLQYLHRHYYGITRNFVQTFCKTCPTCSIRDT